MAGKNIESLYSALFSMRSTLEDMVQEAQGVINSANQFGGEINRVVGEQMQKYFIPTIHKMIDDTSTPGSLKGVITFLDSVPLAMTRVEPQAEQVSPAIPVSANITEPAGTSESKIPTDDEPALGASFNHPEGISTEHAPVVESKKTVNKRVKESAEIFQVVRSSNKTSALGDIANLEDSVVAEMDTEEEANEKAKDLNDTVNPEEKDAFGTEYKVVKKTIEVVDGPKPATEITDTTEKKVKESIRGNTKQFLSNVESLVDDYCGNNTEGWEGMEENILALLGGRTHSIIEAIRQYVGNGEFAMYYDDARKDLAFIYENTSEEKEKWSKYPEDKMWDRYVNVMTMYLPKVFKRHMGRDLGEF